MQLSAPFRHLALMLCSVLLFSGSSVQADLVKGDPKKADKKEKPIPEAKEATVRFGAGQSVVIELAAAIGSLNHIDFVIRERPEHGTLSAIKPHPKENNKALVTYTHRAGAPMLDRFSFSCKLDDGPSSAAGVITLVGQIMEPKLEVKQAPRFGRVALGGEASGKVSVKNSGLAPFVSEMKWPAPWIGPPQLSLKPGETQDFLIALRPQQSGVFRLDMELQPGHAASKLMLVGECSRVLTVSPGELMLTLNPKTGLREGVLTLVNTEADQLFVGLRLPPRLSGPTQVDLSARERREVVLTLASSDIEAFKGDVEVFAGKEVERCAIQAAPKPGELRLVTPPTPEINLGELKEKEKATGSFTVRNTGGQPLVVDISTNPPLTLDTANAGFRLSSLEERQITVTLAGAQVGAYSGEIKVSAGSTSYPIVVKAQVNTLPQPTLAPVMAAAPVYPKNEQAKTKSQGEEGPQMPNAAQQLLASVLATEGMPPPAELINPDLERVERADLIERTSNSISIAWKKPRIPPAAWVIEFANYVTDAKSGITSKDWKICSTAKIIDSEKERVGVLIHSLKPSTNYEARIMAVDREGKVSHPSPVFQLITAPAPQFPPWLLWLIVLLILCTGLYFLNRIRRGDFPAFAWQGAAR